MLKIVARFYASAGACKQIAKKNHYANYILPNMHNYTADTS